jgi:hypothetical protein
VQKWAEPDGAGPSDAAARVTGRRNCPAGPGEPAARILFYLFYQVEIRHRRPSNDNPAPASGGSRRRI